MYKVKFTLCFQVEQKLLLLIQNKQKTMYMFSKRFACLKDTVNTGDLL